MGGAETLEVTMVGMISPYHSGDRQCQVTAVSNGYIITAVVISPAENEADPSTTNAKIAMDAMMDVAEIGLPENFGSDDLSTARKRKKLTAVRESFAGMVDSAAASQYCPPRQVTVLCMTLSDASAVMERYMKTGMLIAGNS